MDTNTNRQASIAHARACDERIAAAWSAYYAVADRATELLKEASRWERTLMHYAPGVRRERIEAMIAAKREQAAAITAEAEPLRDAARALDTELYEGWARFFMVQHIHSSASCSSFRPTTRVGWLPSVSGLTEAEAVAEHGSTLCTICFPSAPVELTMPKPDGSCTGVVDPALPSRRGYYRGNWATCSYCGQAVTLTPSGKLRKHKLA